MKFTRTELSILTQFLADTVEEGTTPSQRKLAKTLTRLRLRIEAELEKSPKSDREVRWAAAVIGALAERREIVSIRPTLIPVSEIDAASQTAEIRGE